MTDPDMYTSDGVCLLDCQPCSQIPIADCSNCNSYKDYILNTTGCEE